MFRKRGNKIKVALLRCSKNQCSSNTTNNLNNNSSHNPYIHGQRRGFRTLSIIYDRAFCENS